MAPWIQYGTVPYGTGKSQNMFLQYIGKVENDGSDGSMARKHRIIPNT
jgi:hypothetical protein